VCRLGGDEFVIVMPGTGLHGGLEIAERIRAAIASDGFAVAAGGRPIAVTVSAGLAESTGGLLRRALAPRRQGALPVETGRTQSRFGRSCAGLIKMAGWPMERLEIAERDPRSGNATLRRAGTVLPGNCPSRAAARPLPP
ncbi:MAG: hypothetical protein CR217_18165, partial [Beijerinckiaceae bacterium]